MALLLSGCGNTSKPKAEFSPTLAASSSTKTKALSAGESLTVTCPNPEVVATESPTAVMITCTATAPTTTSTTVAPTTTTGATTTTTVQGSTTTSTTVPVTTTTTVPANPTGEFTQVYEQWSNGPDPSGNPDYYPIAVWEPNSGSYATAYDALGVTTAIQEQGTTTGFTDGDYDNAGSGQFGLSAPWGGSTGIGSYLIDEPDLNQVNYGTNNGLTAPAVAASAAAAHAADPTRPTYANFGKCFSEPGWDGCQTGKTSPPSASVTAMDQLYCSNVDVASSDYYGYTDPYDATGSAHYYGAWTYGRAVANTKAMCGASKPVLGFVETGTPFSVSSNTITGPEITAATWDAILHGANGIIYFDHDFSGQQSDNGMIDGKEKGAIANLVKANDAEITSLAPWLNAPNQSGVTVTSTGGIPVTTMLKTYNGHTYLFAQADGTSSNVNSGATTATITVPVSSGTAAVYDESRSVSDAGGTITDSFSAYQVHIYELS